MVPDQTPKSADSPALSYAQRFEDFYLLRCFGAVERGFYIDIGSGHPVVDNVSFAFYRRGWNGITVEPNPYLARLARAARPRDHCLEALVGAAAGRASFFLVEEFHGFSTTIESNAAAAKSRFGKSSQGLVLPVVTLKEICQRHAPPAIEFLKIDVEGAEADVVRGADWQRFRPKVVLVEALAPYTMAPAFEAWEPVLLAHGYRYVFFDNLNRYYLAEEAEGLAVHFATAPKTFDAVQFGTLQPALDDARHPDRGLAALLVRAAMIRLPLIERGAMLDFLTAELAAADLERAATPDAVAAAWSRVFGAPPAPRDVAGLQLPPGATVRDLYAGIAESDAFRVACGRISASYAW